ncbi:putative Zn-dependent peptidase [Frankia casuarinae]|uniref:Processing peptidase n=1 Tax=Frankia casuarinae (strain DSM 45818 / CECT 9043 / HFP020203 / CcI3) TaxID=106370 RepID=Q2J736_FRACC|nr:processing peptidase [Frankia casuarinae]ETA03509.1 putative Zn-dependent peptidase [Frankia sp. CcI6]KDA43697.1 putative Zn-dependent peptidase [Frankia sp. BMG5.23]KFB05234.1 putative Zn-dependent peptidase [Frankia sp. Allo2]TFE31391.1 insulinase family protein [Frankia sp. B2]
MSDTPTPDLTCSAGTAGAPRNKPVPGARAAHLLAAGGVSGESLLDGTARRTVLPGGLRVITERVPGVRSVAIGVWVAVGSRDETPVTAGCSHYLEHLLFKGTPSRDALTISASVEAVGGDINAFTGKEYTCYYVRVLDSDLAMAVNVIADMVTNSLVTADDVEAERGVILEEIAMYEDDPGDLVHDVFAAAMLGSSVLGRPVLGTTESIEGLGRETIADYYRSRYVPPAMVVSIAGNLAHDRALALVAEAFADRLTVSAEPFEVRGGSYDYPPPPGIVVTDRPTEQAHLVLGTRGLSRHDPRRYTLGVLSTALGGGMSSRLFQEIREKRGLAYSVGSFASHFADAGLFGVYAGCAPKRADVVLELAREQVRQIAEHGISAEELDRARGQNRGSMILGLEDTGSRMSRLGKSELVHGEVLSVDEIIARVDAVTLDDVTAIARELLDQSWALGVIGPFDDHDFSAAVAR